MKAIKTKCQGKCPQCKSVDIDYLAIEFQDGQCCYPFACNECDYEGKEWYVLKYVETI